MQNEALSKRKRFSHIPFLIDRWCRGFRHGCWLGRWSWTRDGCKRKLRAREDEENEDHDQTQEFHRFFFLFLRQEVRNSSPNVNLLSPSDLSWSTNESTSFALEPSFIALLGPDGRLWSKKCKSVFAILLLRANPNYLSLSWTLEATSGKLHPNQTATHDFDTGKNIGRLCWKKTETGMIAKFSWCLSLLNFLSFANYWEKIQHLQIHASATHANVPFTGAAKEGRNDNFNSQASMRTSCRHLGNLIRCCVKKALTTVARRKASRARAGCCLWWRSCRCGPWS